MLFTEESRYVRISDKETFLIFLYPGLPRVLDHLLDSQARTRGRHGGNIPSVEIVKQQKIFQKLSRKCPLLPPAQLSLVAVAGWFGVKLAMLDHKRKCFENRSIELVA